MRGITYLDPHEAHQPSNESCAESERPSHELQQGPLVLREKAPTHLKRARTWISLDIKQSSAHPDLLKYQAKQLHEKPHPPTLALLRHLPRRRQPGTRSEELPMCASVHATLPHPYDLVARFFCGRLLAKIIQLTHAATRRRHQIQETQSQASILSRQNLATAQIHQQVRCRARCRNAETRESDHPDTTAAACEGVFAPAVKHPTT